ncbi:MAG: HYR domain-containing protein, partial [Bacteroidota bacterium]
ASVNLNAAGAASITTADVFQSGSDNCGTVNQVSVTPNSFTCANTGPNTVTFTANDGKGNTATCSATVTVSDVTPPSVTCKNASVNLNAAGSASITTADVFQSGSDNCGVVNQVSVTPNTFTCANTGPNTVTFTANDGKGNTATCSATVTVSDVTPPTVVCKNATVNLSAAGTVSITTATVFQSGSDNCGTVNQVSVTPNSFTCANTGPNTVTLAVNDGKGNNNTCTATVTVADVTPPSVTCKNASVNLNAAGAASITTADVFQSGSDNCGVVNQVSVTPNSFTCANTGANTVTLTVNDGKGNNNTCTATVTVSDVTPPTVVCKNATVNLNAAGTASITTADVFQSGSDNCGTVNQVSVTPNSFTCANTGPNTVTLTVNDGKGNNNTCTATVTVVDNIAPKMICQPATIQLNAAGQASLTPAQVNGGSFDNCSISNLSVTPNTFTCANQGTNTVTLTGTDPSNNSSTCTAVVTVVDLIAPVAVCKAASVVLGSNGTFTIPASLINNGSSDNCSFNLSVLPAVVTCANIGITTVTLKATDGNGNTSTCTAQVTVRDVTGPNALCKNPTVYLNDEGHVTITAADVDNGSNDPCGILSRTINFTQFNCSNIATPTVVTLTVKDIYNNTSTCLSNVIVKDNLAPTAVCQNATVSLNAAGKVTVYGANLANNSFDNCSVYSYTPIAKIYTTANLGPNNLTITVKDWSGNPATCVSVVTVMPYNSSITNDDRSNQAENTGLDLRLYPNPTAGEAVLAFELPENQDYNLQVTDMTGRVIMRQKQDGVQGENNTLLESNNWPGGVYLIRIESGGVQAQKRLVVVGK